MLQQIRSAISGLLGKSSAAAALPPIEVPKVPRGATSIPGFRKSIAVQVSPVSKPAEQQATKDRLDDLKGQSTTQKALSSASRYSPELSSATSSHLRTGIPEEYKIIGRSSDGQFSTEVTQLAHELVIRLTFGGNQDGSFGDQLTLQSLSETLGQDLLWVGACCVELVVDERYIPASLNVVAASTLVFKEEEQGFSVVQRIGGKDIPLDLATIIYVSVDQRSDEIYPSAPMEAAVNAIAFDLDFSNDVRRALKRAVLPRLQATIDLEKLAEYAPPDVKNDADKWQEYQNTIADQIQKVAQSLTPEDILISDSMTTWSYVEGGHDPSTIIERVQSVINAKTTAGVRALPVSLGFSGTANSASAETLLYVKQVDMIRRKLNEVYSRALTVAVKLLGLGGYVEFVYDPINIRPDDELEAFRSMKQSRLLDLYSLGFLSRDETSVLLTGHLPPATAPDLSGKLFRQGSAEPIANPTSNTSATEQTLKPGTPQQPKTSK